MGYRSNVENKLKQEINKILEFTVGVNVKNIRANYNILHLYFVTGYVKMIYNNQKSNWSRACLLLALRVVYLFYLTESTASERLQTMS